MISQLLSCFSLYLCDWANLRHSQMSPCKNANKKTHFFVRLKSCDVDGAGLWQWTNTNWVTGAHSPFAHTLYIYIYTLRDILCSGLADLFTSWFIFIVVICHWPDGLVSEAHIINHGGHYCSIITLSLSEPATFPACALSISVYNTRTVGM